MLLHGIGSQDFEPIEGAIRWPPTPATASTIM
jgi:hypothetical protein